MKDEFEAVDDLLGFSTLFFLEARVHHILIALVYMRCLHFPLSHDDYYLLLLKTITIDSTFS